MSAINRHVKEGSPIVEALLHIKWKSKLSFHKFYGVTPGLRSSVVSPSPWQVEGTTSHINIFDSACGNAGGKFLQCQSSHHIFIIISMGQPVLLSQSGDASTWTWLGFYTQGLQRSLPVAYSKIFWLKSQKIDSHICLHIFKVMNPDGNKRNPLVYDNCFADSPHKGRA